MLQSYKEEEEIQVWLGTQHIPTLAKKLRMDAGKFYRLRAGTAKNPSFQTVRELQLEKQKQEQ